MDWQESASSVDIVEQAFFLFLCDPADIGKDHQCIVFLQCSVVQAVRVRGVSEVDPPWAKALHDLRNSFRGPVMPVVTQEEHLKAPGLRDTGKGDEGGEPGQDFHKDQHMIDLNPQ